MSVRPAQRRDLADDPGLVPTELVNARGPYVGTPARRRIRRFAHDARLERIFQELYASFGPQRWWPARTPFEVLIGAVLTQNTAWRNVELALEQLAAAGALTPARILALESESLQELIRPSGYYRAKAQKLCELSHWYLDRGGLAALRSDSLEPLRTALLEVWGVGPETADSILCYAAGRRTVVVDAYTRRILARHGFGAAELPYEDLRAWLMEVLVNSQVVYEEFHALCVRVGYDHCKPSPRCAECPATALL